MNGASIFMVLVLVVGLLFGLSFLVGQLNQNAEEIMADRATIQDLQNNLEQAQLAAVRQQQAVAELNGALSQAAADLEQSQARAAQLQQANDTLQASVSQQSTEMTRLSQALQAEQSARAAAEQQGAAQAAQVRTLQDQVANLETQLALLKTQTNGANPAAISASRQPVVPVTGAASLGGANLPWAASAAGLVLGGGLFAWNRRVRRVHSSSVRSDWVAVTMTRSQAHTFARFVRSQAVAHK